MPQLRIIATSENGVQDIDYNFALLAGEGASEGFTHIQNTPASVWGPFAHGLGHIPSSVVLWIGGNMGLAETHADDQNLTVILGSNQTGTLRAR